MRPVSLTLEGFGAFKSATTLDFSDLDLVAFVGQTGAGKSTIIDAIGFALYGSVPRYDKVNVVSPVIHQLANEAKVSLEFSLGEHNYRATRVVRRQNSKDPSKVRATTKEARLELVEKSADESEAAPTKVLAGNVKELDATVERLLGLSFAQFTKTIVLPQGAFAKFLTDEPAERQKLIRRLLDLEIYSQMGAKARERAKTADAQLEILEAEKVRYEQGLASIDIKSLAARGKALTKFSSVVAKTQTELDKIDQAISPLSEQQEQLEDHIERLAKLGHHDDVASVIEQADIGPASDALKLAETELEKATTAEAEASENVLAAADLVVVKEQIGLHQQLETANANQTDAAETFKALKSEIKDKSAELKEAEQALDKAKSELETATTENQAASIRQTLEAGDICPVCENEIGDVGHLDSDFDFAGLKKKKASAESHQRKVTTELAALTGRSEALEQQLGELNELVKDLSSKVKTIDPLEVLEKTLAEDEQDQLKFTEAKTNLATAVKAHTLAIAELEKVRQTERGLMSSFAEVRDTVADLSPPAITDGGVLENWENLNSWAQTTNTDLEKKLEKTLSEAHKLKEQRNQASSTLLGEANDLGLNLAQVGDIVAALAEAQNVNNTQIAKAETVKEEVERLNAEIEHLTETRTKDYALGRHLNATGFEGWLLTEALGDICASATTRLLELTDQQFSLELVGRQFYIVDHNNASERRDVKTLSGGETFLASLALALGLADSIAELATNNSVTLGSMFLDEGFGTLDTETLDTVASAIEELAASGRMIGVVTHVRELAERLPTRFEVTKGPAGSWVEKVER